ncbi:class I SAM-dependent methyltransferase [Streptomyces sp. NPDC059010]|uniref:class I SAM-dependent methyltransferase n=1 Tax=Streptomyces sp. NPDC059010 TaxID=3346695 RepID=UPI0036B73200
MTWKNGRRWNSNIHYHPRILHAVPADAHRALDIGCGEGMLARELRRTVPQVTGIDLHAPSIEQGHAFEDDVDYVLGDFLTHPFEPAEMRALAAEILPGSEYRRHLLWRYSIVWRKPQD